MIIMLLWRNAQVLLYSVKWLPCDGRRRSTRLPFSWRSYGVNAPRSVPSISGVRILRAHFGRDSRMDLSLEFALNMLTWFLRLRSSQSRLAREG
jgi:hypothetical protein